MPGIYIAAALAGALALAAIGTFLLKGASAEERRLYAALLILQLPMSWFTFQYVRVPLDAWLRIAIADRELYTIVTLFYAPVTEELAKLWPVLLPWVWRRLVPATAVRIALALGLGFGLGEIAFLADRLARVPTMAPLPWYHFGGFVTERIAVCVWHSAFTAVVVFAAARAAVLLPLGFLGAAVLHFVGNLPIYLASRRVFGLTQEYWQLALFGWTMIYTIALALLLFLITRATGTRFLAASKRKCRFCGAEYKAPIMGLNLGAWRYERCSSCGKSQWI
jgi:hypothetical protein